MSDNTTTAPQRTKLTSADVPRNEVSLTFIHTEIMRGKEKGWNYLAPDVNEGNLDTVIAWMGRAIAASKLGAFLRGMSQGWWGDAEEEAKDKETGVLDMAKAYEVFAKLATDFSARGESIPKLKEAIEELVNQMTELDPTDGDFAMKFASYAKEVKELQLAISLKRRKTDEDNGKTDSK